MSFLTRNLLQTATLWTRDSVDSYGDPTFSAPVSILVRWEQKTELFVNVRGEEKRSNSVVFLDRDVAVGDFLLLGTSTAADPTSVQNAQQVQDFRKIPSLDGSKYERRAIL